MVAGTRVAGAGIALRTIGRSELIDYAASLKTDSLFITDLKPFENFSESYLKD